MNSGMNIRNIIFLRRWLLIIGILSNFVVVEQARSSGSALITPPYVIMSSKDRSMAVGVSNPSEDNLEIWISFKYSYNANGDSGKVVLYAPDSLQPDDASAAGWLKAYPSRFVLGPHESQTIRLAVAAPPGIANGEYWARVILTQKPQTRAEFSGGKKLLTGIKTILVYSAPFLYRQGEVTTGIALTGSLQYRETPKNVEITIPLRRSGNASYWGIARCRLTNGSGKQVYTHDYNVVVYKDFSLTVAIDRASVPAGDYTAEFEFRTERSDIRKSLLIHAEPLTCSIPIRIQ